ncbi:MAG TPA: leucyl aminopeptidase [Acidimicrobiales bacterium]|nr:leucyl aminopeptidase [Acidimicrobiales bacterium]
MPLSLEPDAVVVVTSPDAEAEISARGLFEGGIGAGGVDAAVMAAGDFEAKAGQTLAAEVNGRPTILVGLGTEEDLDVARLRKAAGALARRAGRAATLVTDLVEVAAGHLRGGVSEAARAVTEGLLSGSYRFDTLKGNPGEAPALESVLLRVGTADAEPAAEGVRTGRAIASAVSLVRDLVNTPASEMRAVDMADAAIAAGAAVGVEVEAWDLDRCRSERLGGLLGVNAGSVHEPRLIRMEYSPEGAERTVVLVGKGVTFDTGGLSLKTSEGMMTMKTDMAGAAAVVAVMSALPALAPSVRVVGLACCTDNQPGPTATMPGDVLTIRNGKTVEVLNTDAEGRLVLADGLSLAAEMEPEAVIDLATLTGACMVALGKGIAGLMGNDDDLISTVREAADITGERVWPLPLPDIYRKQLDSDVADLRNIGAGRYGGALTAGLFLEEFVGDTPWVHLDIAGPAGTDEAGGEYTKGATGFGVRTVLEAVVSLAGSD